MINTISNPKPSRETMWAAVLSESVYEHEWPTGLTRPRIVVQQYPQIAKRTLKVSIPLQRNLWGTTGQQNLLIVTGPRICWIAFEGTAQPETWLYNLDGVSPVAFGPRQSAPLVHAGLFNLMMEVLNGLLSTDYDYFVVGPVGPVCYYPPKPDGNHRTLLSLIASMYQPESEVIWTGHSAGAVLANMTSAWLLYGNVPSIPYSHPFLQARHRVIDFGCPRFIHNSSPVPGFNLIRERHAHARDLVPHVPLGTNWTHWGTGNFLWSPKGELYKHPILVHHSLQLLVGNVGHYLSGLLTGTLRQRILNNHAAGTYRKFICGGTKNDQAL